jgi:hypothetical protein
MAHFWKFAFDLMHAWMVVGRGNIKGGEIAFSKFYLLFLTLV